MSKMNKLLQVKDAEKRSANVQRTASYRLALRRSAPPEAEDLLTKESENTLQSDETVVTSQPSTQNTDTFRDELKMDIKETNDVQTEPMLPDHKIEATNGFKSNGFSDENRVEVQNECTKFCCQIICCNYCKCCPNCCSIRMRRMESVLIHITECGLNCLRVFT